ncbi:MAG: type II/IV secretion system ATPase subunit [Candidatus Thermoplasmatota archaeon]|nr:type II/IV secretion system ATPase subunit [Candidatus Thermoplasmatota archaeon]
MGKQKEMFAGLSKTLKKSKEKNDKNRQNKKFNVLKNELVKHTKHEKEPKESAQKTSFTINKTEINALRDKLLSNEGFSDQALWEEIDFYDVAEPFAFVSIIQHQESRDKRYMLIEPPLNEQEKQAYDFIYKSLHVISVDVANIEQKGMTNILEESVNHIISDYSIKISEAQKEKILYYLKKNLLSLDKLDPIMKDPQIEDISCDGSEVSLFLYHRNHGSIQSNIHFDDEEELSGFVIKLAQKCGKHISIANPMIDATMPDGSRIQMTLSTEISTKGSTFTIRKFREEPFSPPDLIRFNTMSSEMIAYFWMAIEHGFSALISGGTASGKTTTLNALSLFVPRESKIVSIEETREINLPHPNWIPGVSRSGFGDVVDGKISGEIDMYDLMKAALRQRPEYILVGEIRGREAYVLFQAMATGHTTYSTVHADSTKSLIHRLEGEPINIPRIMLQSLDIVCLQTISRVKNKRTRRVKQIIEIIDIDPSTKELLTNEVFRWDPVKDSFQYSGKSFVIEQIRGRNNMDRATITTELKQRAKVLEWMLKNNITQFEDVATSTAKYCENKNEVLTQIEMDTHGS